MDFELPIISYFFVDWSLVAEQKECGGYVEQKIGKVKDIEGLSLIHI